MAKKSVKKSRKFKALAAAVVVVAVLAGGGYLLARHNTNKLPAEPAGVKLAPATPQEKADSEANKDRIVQQQQSNTPPTSTAGQEQVSVIITSHSADSVDAYVTGVFEDGGTCTATFTQGSTTITRTSTAFSNVSYTQCPPIKPDLPNSGSWSFTVSYSSSTAEGTSQAQTL